MPIEASAVSPRLTRLQNELTAGNTAALYEFWQEMQAHGTPLIEPTEDDHYALVTLVCRAPLETKAAGIITPFSNRTLGGQACENLFDIPAEAMTRVPDTDLWYRAYRLRTNLRTQYEFVLDGVGQPDRNNPLTVVYPAQDEQAWREQEWVLSVLALPAAPPQPWMGPRPGVGRGKIVQHRLRSSLLNNERRVSVYTPFGYVPEGEDYPLLVLFDGTGYERVMATPTVLDNLIAAGEIPPLVAVMISSLDFETRQREILCNPTFAQFMIQELVPMIRRQYHVSTDASRTMVGGYSAGGLTAAYLALKHPDIFGKVLSQSGPFWWKPDDDPEEGWLARQFGASPRLPIDFYLECGLRELGNRQGQYDFLESNRQMQAALQATGYTVHYSEYNGSHDWACWRGSLADGLMALIGTNRRD